MKYIHKQQYTNLILFHVQLNHCLINSKISKRSKYTLYIYIYIYIYIYMQDSMHSTYITIEYLFFTDFTLKVKMVISDRLSQRSRTLVDPVEFVFGSK